MAKFYVFLLRGTCDPDSSECAVFDTSEQVQDYLLANADFVDNNPEEVFVIRGDQFGFNADRKAVAFRLVGPPSEGSAANAKP